MIQRCHLSGSIGYADYGGRGIFVCTEWRSGFDAFYEWALSNGYEVGLSLQLDRINNDGPYSPDNCRWVSPTENARNKRNTRFIEAWNERKPLMEWVDDPRCLVRYGLLSSRIYNGWDGEAAMTRPAGSRKVLPGGKVAKKPPRKNSPWVMAWGERKAMID